MTDKPFDKPVFIKSAVVAGVQPVRGRSGHEKGKKMYKLATPGSDTYHKQIALLLQCYDDLGIHRGAYGNKTRKWEAGFRDKFTQELLAEHKILLQGGTNEGKKPSLATLKAWFDKWFKMYDEFAPKFEEGKLNATGNPHAS
jgi:hypothetical protein